MSDKLKKLTSKNPKEYEPVAYNLINESDIDLFKELTDKDDFLFDFIKNNVIKRISKYCNQTNYLNLLNFLKYYSPTYEEFIVTNLSKYADEDLTDTMLDLLENGTNDEKKYCAKFFSYIQDPLALDLLKQNLNCDDEILKSNCAATLGKLNDLDSYNNAIQTLDCQDDFEKLNAVKFLVSYGNKNATEKIINIAKTSPFAENIASELPYLYDLSELIYDNKPDGLYILNLIINGLGETVALYQLYDFGIFEIFENMINNEIDSMSAVIILNAQEKFEQLTENEEYLFDEPKEVKEDVFSIKDLLKNTNFNINLEELAQNELHQDSLFVYTALDFAKNETKIRNLLTSNNQTIILKAIETLKNLNILTQDDKQIALTNVRDENIKNIINAL